MRSYKIKTVLLILFILPVLPLFSHGTEYTILSDRVIKILASYDTGEVFSDCDVLVYYPGEKEVAYSVKTDNEGIFYLQPDRDGTWIIQVRGENGHGLRINLTIEKSMVTGQEYTNHLTLMQKLLMVISVGWGAMGTALYFRKKE